MAKTIYLDESGCLGWSLDQPYGRGGSSRYFTLAAAVIPDDQEKALSRVIRGLYKKRRRSTDNELKSVALSSGERDHFATQLSGIKQNYPDITFATITVRKEHVQEGFRRHPNGLYNYMAKLLLLKLMAQEQAVHFIPDARTIKVELKHSMHDYLRTELAACGSGAFLQTTPWESKDCLPLQFVDILAGVVWGHHEFKSSPAYKTLSPHVTQKSLFFNPPQPEPIWVDYAPYRWWINPQG
ncbi:DUF3800 domain-containing protein [Burkholderia sp. Bp9031]|uniref:DUF3800 domain-containing protein n=1 Tax=Burkholderia sp. Bp9031 TaxID=2184566 RepID=UPI000F5EF0EB|nr:DUF3800 domain-containing protein [Burkholderia sp. Bp9031]RQZ14036.1 DUF3800 domain-containing protein [Burkholderia sp. Bp9031]